MTLYTRRSMRMKRRVGLDSVCTRMNGTGESPRTGTTPVSRSSPEDATPVIVAQIVPPHMFDPEHDVFVTPTSSAVHAHDRFSLDSGHVRGGGRGNYDVLGLFSNWLGTIKNSREFKGAETRREHSKAFLF